MASNLDIYDPKKVVVQWGAITFSGFGGAPFVTAEFDNPKASLKTGVTGDSTLAVNQNKSGKITVVLGQGSATNLELSTAILAAEKTSAGILYLPFIVTDIGGAAPSPTLIFAPNAWCETMPPVSFGDEAEDREWVFRTDYLEMLVGSN